MSTDPNTPNTDLPSPDGALSDDHLNEVTGAESGGGVREFYEKVVNSLGGHSDMDEDGEYETF